MLRQVCCQKGKISLAREFFCTYLVRIRSAIVITEAGRSNAGTFLAGLSPDTQV